MLINNKHITPFFSSTYSCHLEKRFKNDLLSVKGAFYLSPGLGVKGAFLHIKSKKVSSFNLPDGKEKNFFYNKKNQFSYSPNTLESNTGSLNQKRSTLLLEDKNILLGGNINNPYYITQNQKLNKILLDLQKFLKKNFFPVSSHLGTSPIKKDKLINYSIFPFYKKLIKGFIGKELNAHNQQLTHSKSITYSFKNNNNVNSLLSSTKLIDIFLKKFFISIGTLISKPIYLNRQDKIIIRLFVYFSPKLNLFLKTSLLNQSSWKVFSNEQMILNSSTPIKVTNYQSINRGGIPDPKDLNNNVEGDLINPLFNFISNINKVEGALANKKNQILFSSFSIRQKNKSWSSLLSNYTKKIAYNLISLNNSSLPFPSLVSVSLTETAKAKEKETPVTNSKKESLILSNPSLLQGSLPLSPLFLDNGINGKEKMIYNLPEPTFIKGSLFNYESYFTLFKPYLENFSLILGSILNKKVELEIVKLQFPFHDSSILAQILGINANKYNFTLMVKKILQLSHLKNPSKNI
jgi:hypothetical protein